MPDKCADYQSIRVDGRIAYVKADARNHLGEVQAVIFDCDGVLIDTRRSYNTTIVRTARYILSQLLGFPFPQRVITQSIIQALRSSGGFNNDWDSTYAIVLYLLSCLPGSFLRKYAHLRSQISNLKSQISDPRSIERMHAGLSRFVEQADSSGIAPLEKILFEQKRAPWKTEALLCLKALIGYPENGADSLLAVVFDEIFYGSELFQKAHGRPPKFHTGSGAIENEIPIVTQATLDRLTGMVGPRNLGIASGRGTLAIEWTLGRLLDSFNPRARILLEDEELKSHDDIEALRTERAKPAPYSLLKSARAMKKFKRALYVGDSAEDLIMARRANESDPRYLFAGVTDYGYDPGARKRMFAGAAVDLIVPSVNQLPEVLQAIRSRT
jgi:phosphoglycolate phosphatase-like HAD superfamily hydrolase